MIDSVLATSLWEDLWDLIHDHPDPVIIGMFILCGAGLPVPEEPILLLAGSAAHWLSSGENAGIGFQLTRMTVDCTVGILLGDLLCFSLGRGLGPGILKWRWVQRVITRKRQDRAEEFFDRYGNWSIFIARFFAGVRIVMYFSAGMSRKISYWRFLLMDFLGVLVSVPISVWIGFKIVKELDDIQNARSRLGPFQLILVAAIAVGLVVWFVLARKTKATEPGAEVPPPPAGEGRE